MVGRDYSIPTGRGKPAFARGAIWDAHPGSLRLQTHRLHGCFLFQAGRNDATEVIEADWLREEGVHASFFTFLFDASEGMAGHGDDGWLVFKMEIATNAEGRLNTAHDRHLQVHEDDVVAASLHHLDGFLAVVGDIDTAVAETLHEHDGDFLIQWLIFD